jgi:hypothetical protein
VNTKNTTSTKLVRGRKKPSTPDDTKPKLVRQVRTTPITPISSNRNNINKNSVDVTKIEEIVKEIILKELARLGFIQHFLTSDEKNDEFTVPLDSQNDDDPMDIDLIRLKNSKDLLALEGVVNGKMIQILADSCANASFIPQIVCNDLGMKIDTSKVHKLSGASGEKKTLGTIKNVSIELTPGCIIKEDLVVIDYPYREIGLSRACLKRYNYDIHESRNHIALTCDEKDFFIPIVADKNRSP